jgi:hypothetical protein
MNCKGCNGVFGTVIKDEMCSHCIQQIELEEYVNDSIQESLLQEIEYPSDGDKNDD